MKKQGNIDTKIVAESDRIYFRYWTTDDAKDLVAGLNNFDTAKYLTVPYPYTLDDAFEFINKYGEPTIGNHYFAIVLKDNDRVIGGTSLSYDKALGKNGGGIWIGDKFTGQGYGPEAFRLRAKLAFEVFELTELYNGFYDYNERSWKMQQKIGYKIVGEKTNYCPALQKEVKEVLTKLTKEDFYKF